MRIFALLAIMLGLGVSGSAYASEATKRNLSPEIISQVGHSGRIEAVAISPDGKIAASASHDKTVKLWHIATGRLLRTLSGHAEEVHAVAFSPDGTKVISGAVDHKLKVWDAVTGRLLQNLEIGNGATWLSFSPSGRYVLLSSEMNEAQLWDITAVRKVRTFEDVGGAIAISPDGTKLLTGDGGEVNLREFASGKLLTRFKAKDLVLSLAFSQHGRFIAVGEREVLEIWDTVTGLGRTIQGGTGPAAFSPNGDRVLSAGAKIYDTATGRLVRTFGGDADGITSGAFSSDGGAVLAGRDDGTLSLWDAGSGKITRSFQGTMNGIDFTEVSRDGRLLLAGGRTASLAIWDLRSGNLLKVLDRNTHAAALSPDGATAASLGNDRAIKVWNVITGELLSTLRPVRMSGSGEPSALPALEGYDRASALVYAPDGNALLSAEGAGTTLWNLRTSQSVRTFEAARTVAFSPEGRLIASDGGDKTVKLWDAATGRRVLSLKGVSQSIGAVAFSPDGRILASGGWKGGGNEGDPDPNDPADVADTDQGLVELWDVATGRLLQTFGGPQGQNRPVTSVAFTSSGRFLLSGSDDNILRFWDVFSGKLVHSLQGHSAPISSVNTFQDQQKVISGSADGTVRIWDLELGGQVAALLEAPDGENIVVTSKGFFKDTRRDTDMLVIARGLEVSTIGQVHQSLFNPDLVREALAGDPDGEVKRAADVINLEKVLDSGPAPEVQITAPEQGSKSGTDLVTVTARIEDRGKGIGRIEWRINGVTAGVCHAPACLGPDNEVKQELALDAGENIIEVVAYNARDLLASLPAHATITYTGPSDTVKPRLHVLAIGINQYKDRGWIPPGKKEALAFRPLKLAVSDAKAIAAEIERAGAGQYGEVRVRTALDTHATAEGLDRVVSEMAAGIGPRDTFVLFAAGHGYSHQGRFYLIPQDYQGGINSEALAGRAIGQEKIQDWIANRIKAKKALILLDTCESGALTNGYAHSRVDAPSSEAGTGRLHEATGRPVLTAAAAGQDALELTELGHGVFTSALIDALYHGDKNGDGFVSVTELAMHVQDLVPRLIKDPKARAALQGRGLAGGLQSARFGSTGEDFNLVRSLH